MDQPLTRIDVAKESMKFSAAHFTVFSATERERLHGHNFAVSASITAPVDDNGLAFNYVEFKRRLRALCDELDEYMIVAGRSPHLAIEDDGTFYRVTFNGETMPFLKRDTLVLPIRNSTVEEYSRYLLERLLADRAFVGDNDVRELEVRVSSGPGQWGAARWRAVHAGG